MKHTRVSIACAGLALIACATTPAAPPMTDQEANSRGLQWCAQHGWGCRLVALRRTGTVVRLEYDAQSRTVHGPLSIELGALDRQVLQVSEPVEAPPPPPVDVAASGSHAAAAVPGVQPERPPGPPPLSEAEVKRLSYDWCRAQGYVCDWASADLAGEYWKTHLRVIGSNAGDIYLQWDAIQRRLAHVDVAVFERP